MFSCLCSNIAERGARNVEHDFCISGAETLNNFDKNVGAPRICEREAEPEQALIAVKQLRDLFGLDVDPKIV